MPDPFLDALARGLRVFDLGREMFAGMPQSPNHPPFRMSLERRHGDLMRPGGGSAANEIIVTGGHVGTHVDALAHVSQDGKLHGGVDAGDAVEGGRFAVHGIETVEPFVCRGVLLDVPAALGVERCAPSYEVTPDDLEAACEGEGIEISAGDVALIRTGWAPLWDDREAYVGREGGTPGPGEEGAKWLASKGVRAAGSDTIAFERTLPGVGHSLLPAHRVLLVENGIHIIEVLNLEELAAAAIHEFLFLLAPLKIVGATGSPVRPLAVVGA